MRYLWGGLSALLLLVAGCRATAPDLKPPPQPEDFSLPPESDQRFSRPHQYPKDPASSAPARKASQSIMPVKGPRSPGMTGLSGGY